MTAPARLAGLALASVLIGCQAAPATTQALPGTPHEPRSARQADPLPTPRVEGLGVSSPAADARSEPPRPDDFDERLRAGPRATGAGAPPERGIDPELAAALQAQLDAAVRERQIPGLSLGVVMPDGSTWSGTSGVASLETGVPLTSDTMFAVASITKSFIAALTIRLAEEGVFSLDDRLSRWVGEIPYADEITLRQLIGHTSGIRDFFGQEVPLIPALLAEPNRTWTPEDVLAYLGPPYWEPGGGWRYSNSNYLLLGLIIQRATGRSVGEELRSRILDPLGLERTFLQPDEVPAGPLADGHTRTYDVDGDGRPDSTARGGPFRPDTAWASSVWTAGAMVSTAEDVARWGDALFGGDVLEPDSLEQMLRFNSDDYGLGAQREKLDGRVSWGHSGMLRGFTGLLLHYPEEDVSLALLTNHDRVPLDEILTDRYGASDSILDLLLDDD